MSPRTINRLKVLAIGVLAVLPVAGSYLLYMFWQPERFTNYGSLIESTQIPAAALVLADGDAFTFEQLRGRWIFVVVDAGGCDRGCERKLWKIRQVRQAQGKDLGRVERVWLVDDKQAPAEQLKRDYAGTWIVQNAAQPVLRAFAAERSNRDHIYLVDPLGNIMMRFPVAAEPKPMIKDLARLLKYSGIG